MSQMTSNGQSKVAGAGREPIAIVGMGCRFPGGANSPAAYWRMLCDGIDAIADIPAGRFDTDFYYDPQPRTPGKIITRRGGFLEQIDRFDADFFGISPRETINVDPQQRLLLEVAWEALEDGGQNPERLAGSQTGVFVGMWTNDYEDLMYRESDNIDLYVTTGGGRYAASGRLSYFFDFRGPSLTVDTACSSSLVAVQLACQSLWSGEAELALAGGVNLIIEPQISIGYSRSGMLSQDAHCKFGDVRADGYVRSEGAGMVVLKPLSKALADQDPVHALIRGGAVNNDGRSSGLLVAPGLDSQIAMLRDAYRHADVPPGQVAYVEAHGTGTKAGDPIELQSLGQVLAEGRPLDRPCVVGSVKTNIGHTEAAAGMAGLIKAVLCLKHRMIPPSLHLQEPNPNIPWDELPLVMQRQLGPLPQREGPTYVGVNGFGITGTNAHVVLQEAPPAVVYERAPSNGASMPKHTYLVPLSAKTPRALREMAQAYQTFLAQPDRQAVSLDDLAYTLARRRMHHAHRLAFVAQDTRGLSDQLSAFLEEGVRQGARPAQLDSSTRPKIVFVFSGQGSQWIGMGRQLMAQEPCFREVIEQCDRTIHALTGWSLIEQLTLDEDSPRLRMNDSAVFQPALFSIQIALAALWRSWGIVPDAVIGHSMGEIAAAYVAGALTLDDALRIVVRRSELMFSITGQGGMLSVELPMKEAEALLTGYKDRVVVGVSNSPRSTVLSGDLEALHEIHAKLQAQEIFCRYVKIDVASHSPYMDPLLDALKEQLQALHPRAGTIPIYSTVWGWVIDGATCDSDYWAQNLRQPVRFAEMVEELLKDGHNIFVEVSPHPVLLASVEQCIQVHGTEALALPSLRRHEDEKTGLLRTLGALYRSGCNPLWERLVPEGEQVLGLPAYPWQRERFWFEAPAAGQERKPLRAASHQTLGDHVVAANGSHLWNFELSSAQFPNLADHRVRHQAILPATAYLEIVLANAAVAFGAGSHLLSDVTFKNALFLRDGEVVAAQLIFTHIGESKAKFEFFSRPMGAENGDNQAEWQLHAEGSLLLRKETTTPTLPLSFHELNLIARGQPMMSAQEHYAHMAERDLHYGPHFQVVSNIWPVSTPNQLLAKLETTAQESNETLQGSLSVMLDGCLQLLITTLQENDEPTGRVLYLPVKVGQLELFAQPDTKQALWGYAVRQSEGKDLVGDLFLLDESGGLLAATYGVELQRIEAEADVQEWMYEVRWQPAANTVESPNGLHGQGQWLILADRQGVAEYLAAQLVAKGHTAHLVLAGATYQAMESGRYQIDPAQPEQFQRLLYEIIKVNRDKAHSDKIAGVIYLWSLDGEEAEAPKDMALAQGDGPLAVTYLLQALVGLNLADAPRLWLVTRGSQPAGESLSAAGLRQSSLWALGAVILNEHPEVRCRRIDLDETIRAQMLVALWQEIQAETNEEQVALRAGGRYVPRLVRVREAEVEATNGTRQPEAEIVAQPGQNYQVAMASTGLLDDLKLYSCPRSAPAPGEVEIEVRATGLNFIDVMKVLGIYPGLAKDQVVALGGECAGIIVAVGEGVEGFGVGDAVLAFNPAFDTATFFRAYVTVPAEVVAAKPPQLSFEEAAAIPVCFLTVYYAMIHLGRLQEGERVLIHSATGGVGLAAIQLARLANAEIYATAGSAEKRAYLAEMGIQHIMDSRSLAFAGAVMAQTHGEGVDMVLNSLAGEALVKSFGLLKPYGRFLEIGKRDIYQNSLLGMEPFRKSLAFYAIDLARLAKDRPAELGRMLRELVQRFEDHTLQPLPVNLFPINNVAEAFRHMAQAKHIGKVVVTVAHSPVADSLVENSPVMLTQSRQPTNVIRQDGTYLISGGLGGLGLATARWLATQGAGHLVLTGRSQPSAEVKAAVAGLEALGTKVTIAQADVSATEQMAALLAQIAERMPPLRGVIHAAGLVDDGLLMQLDQEKFQRVMAPKVQGAWNLHQLTQKSPLDFFVLYSSVSALLGFQGQGNYAAGNGYLDALAHYRRSEGQPALSINWGPWAEVGLAAAKANRGNRLAMQGLGSITPTQGIAILEELIGRDVTQIAVMSFDLEWWFASVTTAAHSPYFDELRQEASAPAPVQREESVRAELVALPAGHQRRVFFGNYLSEQVAQVLQLPPSRVRLNAPFKSLGMDSLMTLELRNRLEANLGLTLSATLIFNYPTIESLMRYLCQKMNISLDAAEDREQSQASAALEELTEADSGQEALAEEDLSQEEVESLLAQELATLDELLKGR